MKKVLFLFVIAGAVSCSNPYVNPNTSKAITEKNQLEELQKQTVLIETQTECLKRIAAALEQIAKK